MNYFGGYYLLKLKTLEREPFVGNVIYTCSDCFNTSLYDTWSLSWTQKGLNELEDVQRNLQIDDDIINRISDWADQNFGENIGWPNVFFNIKDLREYRALFFSHLSDVKILSIYFPEDEATEIIDRFRPNENMGSFGVRDNLINRTFEADDRDEVTIGYDLIGMDGTGGFHSFNCNLKGSDLEKKFGATINLYGLLQELPDWKPVLEYMNDESNGCEPLPWYVCKVKMRLD